LICTGYIIGSAIENYLWIVKKCHITFKNPAPPRCTHIHCLKSRRLGCGNFINWRLFIGFFTIQ